MNGKWLKSWEAKITAHILVWILIFLMPYIFNTVGEEDSAANDPGQDQFRYLNTITNIFWVVLFYLNTEIFTPKFIYKQKYVWYIFLQLIIYSVIMLIHGFFFRMIISGHHFNIFKSSSYNILPFLFTLTVSTAYKVISDRTRAENFNNEIQRQQLKTELSFLRSQISPHFLFNVLNNIVAMVRLKSEELEPTVMKMSSLLQYMLYENDEEKVLLKNEIEYLQSYIDLQKQRFGAGLKLTIDFQVDDEYQTIEPMLLIPFIENAFKHGTGIITKPEIHILLNLTKGFLDFSVRNLFDRTDKSKDKSSGIGLANVKRRLELLYSGKHSLSINESNGWFETRLNIKFI